MARLNSRKIKKTIRNISVIFLAFTKKIKKVNDEIKEKLLKISFSSITQKIRSEIVVLKKDAIRDLRNLRHLFNKKNLNAVVATLLIISFTFQIFSPNGNVTYGATYTFAQTSWAGGADTGGVAGTNYPQHPGNENGWTKYYAASTTINFANASAPTLTTSTYAYTDDAVTSTTGGFTVSGGGFANGTTNNTTYTAGINSSANISLQSSVVNVNAFDEQVKRVPGNVGLGGAMVVTSSYIYVSQGNNTKNIYRYSTAANTWDSLTSTVDNIIAGSNRAMTADSNYVFMTAGSGSAVPGVYGHVLSNTSSEWITYPNFAAMANTGLASDNNYLYFYNSHGAAYGVFRHLISPTNTTSPWEAFSTSSLPNITSLFSNNIAIDTVNGYLYLAYQGGSSTSTVYRHTLADTSSAWVAFAQLTGNVNQNNEVAIDVANQYIYVYTNTPGLYRHTLAVGQENAAWSTVGTSPPAIYGSGASLGIDTSKQMIYFNAGGGQGIFSYHSLSTITGAWSTFTQVPVPAGSGISIGGQMVLDLANSNIYVLQGNTTVGFYRHTNVIGHEADSWSGQGSYVALPANISAGTASNNLALDASNLYVLQAAGSGGGGVYAHSLADQTSNWVSYPSISGYFNSSYLFYQGGNLYVYQVAQGTSTLSYRQANDTVSAWQTYPTIPAPFGTYQMAAMDSQYIYIMLSASSVTYGFRRAISDTTGPWTAYPTMALSISGNPQIIVDPINNYLYLFPTNGSSAVYRRSTGDFAAAWDSVATITSGLGTGFAPKIDSQYLYVDPGQSSNLYRRSINASLATAWTSFSSGLPGTVGGGSAMVLDSKNIYVLQGNGANGFWSHSTSTVSGAFTVLQPTAPVIPTGGGTTMLEDSGGNTIYITQGGGTPNVLRFVINQTTYSSSGDWTSASINLNAQKLNNISWTSSTPAASYGATPVIRFQIATSSDNISWSSFVGPDGTTGSYFTNSGATITGSLASSAKFLKYKAYFATANTLFSPTLNDVTINYDQYNSSGAIVSSKYDSTDPTNVINSLSWSSTVPSGSTLQFQVATSSDGSAWQPWVGPDAQPSTYFTSSGQAATASIVGQYFRYKAFFTSDGNGAPVLTSVTTTYTINAPPTVRVTTQPSQQTNGTVTFSYEVKDIDTQNDTGSINVVTPSFQYCPGGGSTCYSLTALSAGATSTQNVPTGASSTPYSVTWTPSQESFANGVYDTNAVIKVTADDKQAANRYGTTSSTGFLLDTMAPPSTSIHVDASSAPANITLLAVDTSTPITMRLATSLGALSSAVYQAYSTSQTMTLTDPSTVYVQFKDNYSNETTPISVTTPGTPTSVIVQDTTNMLNTPPDYREFIAWKVVSLPPLGFGAYKVYRSTDANEPRNWTLVSSVTDRSINYFTDSSVPSLTVVYYKVVTTDAQGNVSFSSSVVQARADGIQNYGEGGGGGGTGPVISRIATTTPAASSIHVTWDTDILSNSTVGYSTTQGVFGNAVTVASMVNSSTSAGQHEVILANLVPNTTYYFQVRSQDVNGNYTVDNNSSTGYVFTTTDGPTITSGPTASSVFNNSAVITWKTNLPSNSTIFYSTSSDFATSASVSDLSTYNTTHSLTVNSLTPSTQYFYYVRSMDGAGNVAYDQNVLNGVAQYYSFNTTNITTPPVFTNLVAAVNTTTAAISWHTDKLADSRLNYGLTGSYGSSTYDSFLTTGHSITLNDLTPNTTYHYQVVGTDANGNSGQTSDQTFLTGTPVDTTPPVISNVATTSVAIDRATVTWTTSKNTNATVDVGTTLAYGSLFGSLYDFTTSSHSVDLTSLIGNTLYYFRVNSADVIGNSASSTGTFVTVPDVTPPQVLSTSTLISDTAAFVNWNTNEQAIGIVNYGTDPNVLPYQVAVTSTYYISHSLPITGLNTQTQYYYQIVTADPSANTTTLPVASFTTLAAGQQTVTVTKVIDNTQPTDKTAPNISNLDVRDITAFGATVYWTTDKDSSSLVKYGQTASYGFLAGDEITQASSHSVPLINLVPATTYHIKAESFDKSGNMGESPDKTFTTLNVDGTSAKPSSPQSSEEEKQAALDNLVLERLRQAPTKLIASVLDVLSNNPFLKELNDNDAVKAFSEVASQIGNAPIIVGLRPTVEVHGNSATVRWSTDKNTTGLVAYAKESDYAAGTDKPYGTSIVDVGGLSNTHTVELPSLEASTRYHFQVTSKGEIGPEGRSKDYTFETEAVLPTINDAKVTDVKATEAVVSWKTNVPTASDLEFTNLSSSTSKALTSGDQALLINHVFTLRNLEPGSKYDLIIKARNESGEEASSTPLHFETIIDKDAPVISNVAANSTIYPGSASKVQTIISWDTNELAESQLYYQEGVGETENIKSMPLETSFTNKHFIVLTGFKSGSVYKYWINSTDQSGNTTSSDKFTTLTPTEKQTIIDIITNNFQSVFGWTKNVGM